MLFVGSNVGTVSDENGKFYLEADKTYTEIIVSFLGFETLKTIIENERNVIDISFFPENALDLDALAKEKKVTAIVDCGVAPGMDNIILGYYIPGYYLEIFIISVGCELLEVGLGVNAKFILDPLVNMAGYIIGTQFNYSFK